MKVSIVVPVHNAEDSIERTLDGLIRQTFSDIEIICVLNNCSDSSEFILSSRFRDSRLRIVSESIPGAGPARNKGIDVASGDYIAFCDSDDVWLPSKLEVQLESMVSRNAVFSFTGYNVVASGEFVRTQLMKGPFTYSNILLKRFFTGCSTVIVHREFLADLRFPPLRLRQDYIFFCEIFRKIQNQGAELDYVHKPLVDYHIVKKSLSSNKFKALFFQYRAYRCLGLGYLISLRYLFSYVKNALLDRYTS